MTAGERMMEAVLPASLRAELRGDVAVLWLTRPEKRNALNDETILGIETFFAALPPEARAVVIAADGENFSAGLDLSEITERSTVEGVAHSMMWHRAFEKIEFGRVPVVSVLKGAVVGGGLELACATHVRVAERTAYYALPEGQRGIFVGGGASVRVPRLIGAARMADMMLTGRVHDAESGYALGLSQYLVEPGEGLPKALELAGRIAANAPITNFAVIHALPRIAEADPRQGFMMESLMAAVAQGSDDAKQRLRAFLEKRAKKVTEF
ncbi:enoyl-CoA hydratase/carnithine racemase [Azospirillum fermentarium]|uniref:crotonase/enoyl-CoA hydratase family protein n=1 Tax=Azospirillum fermentarium TaxID=1233114 RepID=UPI002227C0E1|nr:crotonase/enoyl-CoA hydratase family protein [Azospirillum fermentarium]MCW2247967.1 enoyl-CoA hydratase/carnithine racemase [Azospirillum fermentarium]